MKLLQIGVTSLRGPDGKFLPSVPVYDEVADSEIKKAINCEHRMIDKAATPIAKNMKKYIETFKVS